MIFKIDRLKDEEYLYCDHSCVVEMVGFSILEQLHRHLGNEDIR